MFAKLCSSLLSGPLSQRLKTGGLGLLLVGVLGLSVGLLGASLYLLYQQGAASRASLATLKSLQQLTVAPLSPFSEQQTALPEQQAVQAVLPQAQAVDTLYLSTLSDSLQTQVQAVYQDRELLFGPERQSSPSRLQTQDYQQRVSELITAYLDEQQAAEQGTYHRLLWLLGLSLLTLFSAYALVHHYGVSPLRRLRQQAQDLHSARLALPELGQAASQDDYAYVSQALTHFSRLLPNVLEQANKYQYKAESLQRIYRSLSSNPLIGVYIAHEGRFTFVNRKLANTLGYDRDYLQKYLQLDDVFLQPRFPSLSTVIPASAHGDNSQRYETRALRADGTHIDVEICTVSIFLEGRTSQIAIVQDISRRVRNEVNSRLAAVVYENTFEAIVVTDRHGLIVDANPAFSRISGYTLTEVRGRSLNLLGSDRQPEGFYEKMWAQVHEIGNWQGDIWSKRKDGNEFAERLTISTAWNPDGTVYRFIALFTDITSHKEREVQMWKQAHHDHLTGLPNRQMFQDRLKYAMERSRQNHLPFALIFMDLDFFKDVNDSLGHKEGDALLQEVASRLQSCVRESDTVARIGGDEFTVIVADIANEEVVDRICRDMLKCISQPFVLGSNTAMVSASLGITMYPEDADDAGELLKNADMAMYAAKACGRNQFCRFLPAMGEAVQARMRFSQDLQMALSEQQFRLYYQPVLDLTTGKINRAEALIRWEHPQLGLVPPSEFIPFSEDSGMIVSIGEWVFENAALQAAHFRTHMDPAFQVSLNVSATQFKLNPACVDDWLAFLKTENIAGQALTVEITERLLLDSNEQTVNQLRKLRAHQVGVALDDFGTGYSSLSYLKRFEITVLKIDQCYIRNLDANSEDFALIKAMVVMAHTLGLKVVAEGVDRIEQVSLLQQIGCDMLQGYLCSRPIPAEQFQSWCEDWNKHHAQKFMATLKRNTPLPPPSQ